RVLLGFFLLFFRLLLFGLSLGFLFFRLRSIGIRACRGATCTRPALRQQFPRLRLLLVGQDAHRSLGEFLELGFLLGRQAQLVGMLEQNVGLVVPARACAWPPGCVAFRGLDSAEYRYYCR